MIEQVSPTTDDGIKSDPIIGGILFSVEGKPMGKARHRFARIGRYVKTYTPKPTAAYEARILASAKAAGAVRFAKDQALEVDVVVLRPIPKSASNKLRKEMENKAALVKPDVDNYLKIVMDALQPDIIPDDSRVVRATCTKIWGKEGRMIIAVKHLRVLEGEELAKING